MVTFTKIKHTISYHSRTIICGNKCTHTGLWMVHLAKNTSNQAASPSATSTTVLAAKVDATSSATKYARYIHQIMCSPPASTLLWVLDLSEEFATIPGLTTVLIKNHLPRSTTTDKQHMHQHWANTTSTCNMQSNTFAARAEVDSMFLHQEICAMQDVFCLAVLVDAILSTMYTDITGAFPFRSFKSMQYVFVAYIYKLNAIIIRTMPSCTDASMVQAFTKVISILKSGGYHPALNVMGNKCSSTVEKYILSKWMNIQLVTPHNHWADAAKCAITTFKEHFISALATVNVLCPLQLWLWDEFLPQVKLTLNMLSFSQQNPKKSANQEV
jgi:hypothetical protein